jgi:hypothetical protein
MHDNRLIKADAPPSSQPQVTKCPSIMTKPQGNRAKTIIRNHDTNPFPKSFAGTSQNALFFASHLCSLISVSCLM